ncbi:MAG: thioesterase family protein [Dermatophilaceae bacterium]
MTPSEFDSGIAVQCDGDDTMWHGVLDDGWGIHGAINGGILMAMGANALRQMLTEARGHPDPLAFSAYFLSAANAGGVTLLTEQLRTGRTMTTAQVSITQRGKDGRREEKMRAIGTFGNVKTSELPVLREEPAPAMPPPQECIGRDNAPEILLHTNLMSRMDLRFEPASIGWLQGKPSQQGRMMAWHKLADGREPDVLSLLWALDSLPPVAHDLGLVGWTPTLEFTAHIRGHPAPGWLQFVLTTQNVSGGLMEEDAKIWDSTGRLVALSRQLCAWRQVPPDTHHPAPATASITATASATSPPAAAERTDAETSAAPA